MNRLIILAALLLSVVGGLTLMSSSSPLAAQTNPSATRSFDPATVAPGGMVTVTVALENVAFPARVTETIPSGFAYVNGSLTSAGAATLSMGASDVSQGRLAFNILGGSSISYQVTAASTDGTYDFSGMLTSAGDATEYTVGGASQVTVSAADPGPPASGPLNLPDLDTGAAALFTAPAGTRNDVSYMAESGDDDAKVSVRVSPGVMAIVNIDLGITVPDDKEVNFSLTDGDNLDFRIKKTGDDTAEIVVKDDVSLMSAGTHMFQLVVNEFMNAPANTEDIDIEVIVVTDNTAPMFAADSPTSGTVMERAKNAMIADFDATDANNQVLTYSISQAAMNMGLTIDSSTGVLSTTGAEEEPRDQPDYDEDNPDANSHTIVITVDDGTLTDTHNFTLTVTDVEDPPEGSEQKLEIDEDNMGGMANSIGPAPALGGSGDYVIGQQIDNHGNIVGATEETKGNILFAIDADSGEVYLKPDKVGMIDYESGTTTYTLSVSRVGGLSGFVVISVKDINEAPMFSDSDKARPMPIEVYTEETAAVGTVLSIGVDASGTNPTLVPAQFIAMDEDSAATGNAISYDLWEGDDLYAGDDAIVEVDSMGRIKVSMPLETDTEDGVSRVSLTLRAFDAGDPTNLNDTLEIMVIVLDRNVAPEFDATSKGQTHKNISEGESAGYHIFTYRATDEDGDRVEYRLRDQDDTGIFAIGESTGMLTLASALDYETAQSHTVEVQAYDPDGDTDEVVLTIGVLDENDTAPMLDGPSSRAISETTKPGTVIGTYTVTDVDTVGKVTLSVSGDAGYMVAQQSDNMDRWDLKTTVWLDADTNPSDSITLVASDGRHTASMGVDISILDADDSITNIYRTKANPLPGGRMGDPYAALADDPANYVTTEWANWGTVLRIRVTNPSPDVANCGPDCVMVNLEASSADTSRMVKARRTLTQANGNDFFAAVKLVEEYATGQDVNSGPGEMAYLKVDEEDEITIKFANARKSVEVENEAPEIDNFMPAHETASKDEDVDYTFTVTDDSSGIPDAEDLPDTDGDADYTSVVALISRSQCDDVMGQASATASLHNGRQIVCAGPMGVIDEGGEYEFRQIVDDKDFSSIDNGVEVETTIAFAEDNDRHYYVTFIACDAAGNCIAYDPDENDDDVALPRITVDTTAPKLVEARTGVAWDATDNDYDDNRSFLQVVFEDLTALNPDTVEVDDFLVAGHVIKAVHMFDPDDEDTPWGDDDKNTVSKPFGEDKKYQMIDRTVFLELEDELAPDEEPKVSILPNGVEDSAANEQDDDDVDADDWIAPAFTVVSIVSPRETSQSEVLAGEDDEVVFTLTSDERLYSPRPSITITYVNAPAGCVNTQSGLSGIARGEIRTGEILAANGDVMTYCGKSATGSDLKYSIEKVSNTEWTITAKAPSATGYYNFHAEGSDRSGQRNEGSEGIAPAKIKTDFFAKNGDVSDDAHFFEGDINLSKPMVRVSGDPAGDDEPTVELRSPLFIELDFTEPFSDDCRNPADNRDDCIAESAEYAEDNYSSVTVTSFVLDGVDITDSVKTTDDETFLVALDDIAAGAHEINIQAMDAAGNALDDTLDIEFEVEERDPFDSRLSPGWNLVSLPGEPADGSIAAVFGGVEVRTVYTYDPVVPGGWMVAVRESLDSEWQGDLMEISGQRGYWVLSDAIQDWEVSIPRLAGGAAGTGTPIQPPSIALYAGWNLIPVTDVTGDFASGISVATYLEDLGTAREIELARVLSFNTIRNEWSTLSATSMLELGRGYWVFVRAPATLVPGN